MRAGEAYKWLNLAPGTYTAANQSSAGGVGQTLSTGFVLQGGSYELSLNCTGTPSMAFQQLGPNGTTFTSLFLTPDIAPTTPLTPAVLAGIYRVLNIPPGIYKITVGTSTANYVSLTRIPQSE